jgi:hypothetical protein
VVRILLLYILPLALWLYGVIDCAADDDVERTGMPKILWMVIIILFPYLGALAWIAVSKIAKPKTQRVSRPANRPASTLPNRAPRRPAPVAPDDNPEFLRRLAEDQARRERERRRGGRSGGDNPTGKGPGEGPRA